MSSLARIGDEDTTVFLTITANEDPYGRFGFPLASKDIKVAEDYDPGMADTTQGIFSVDRRRGVYGSVEVVLFIFSPIGQEYPFLQVSEIFLSRPAISA